MIDLQAYRAELNGVVALPDNEPNVYEMARKIRIHIEEELARPLPNNALIALLCDAARLGDCYIRRIEGEPEAMPDTYRPTLAEDYDYEGIEREFGYDGDALR